MKDSPVERIRALEDPFTEPPWGGSFRQLDPNDEPVTASVVYNDSEADEGVSDDPEYRLRIDR